MSEAFIHGIILGGYTEVGPTPLNWDVDEEVIDARERLGIVIKAISLLMGEEDYDDATDDRLANVSYFGILPFPDLKVEALAFFFYVYHETLQSYRPAVLCVLFAETHRSFVFDNISLIRPVARDVARALAEVMRQKRFQLRPEEFQATCLDLWDRLQSLHESPLAPLSAKRKLKVIFAGLDNSGKTSFILGIQSKYSRLTNLQMTRGAHRDIFELLGAQVFHWDLGGQKKFRERYFTRADFYFLDADLVFFFVDVKDSRPGRLEEAREYLQRVVKTLREADRAPPVVVCLHKVDPDIERLFETRDRIRQVTQELRQTSKSFPLAFFETSIFNFPSMVLAFSYGLSRLSPNRKIIRHQLEWLARLAHVNVLLLVNAAGLVVSDYSPDPPSPRTPASARALEVHGPGYPGPDQPGDASPPDGVFNALKVLELAAPQFKELYNKFRNVSMLPERDRALYKISPTSVIGFLRVKLYEDFYLLAHADSEDHITTIEELLPEFQKRVQPLIKNYIS